MGGIKPWILAILLSPGLALAVGAGNAEPDIRVTLAKDAGVELQLEARQAPLPKILDAIAAKTGVKINYSVLPEGLVTATCVGSTVKPVIECLLDHKAKLIARYPEQTVKANPQGQPLEVWVLGTSFGKDPASASPKAAKAIPDVPGELLGMARSPDPAQRAEAAGRLLAGGRKGDPAVKAALEAALADPDPKVRAQAITSLVLREGAGASWALQQALHDSDVSVRLTAVGRAGGDVALLQQALTDSDASVRELAATQLNSPSKTGGLWGLDKR